MGSVALLAVALASAAVVVAAFFAVVAFLEADFFAADAFLAGAFLAVVAASEVDLAVERRACDFLAPLVEGASTTSAASSITPATSPRRRLMVVSPRLASST